MSHVLLVDDDPNTLGSLSRAFRLAGHEATVCDNAPRAIQLVRDQRFDLILSDVVMPGMDGIRMLEELRAHGVSIPVIMISGQANIDMAVRATKLSGSKCRSSAIFRCWAACSNRRARARSSRRPP